jgi:RNA polymerase sigma factor (sigma-70 family)
MSEISPNDIELLKSSLKGDTASFEAIVKKYQSFICAITFSATGNVGKSEVLAQETFISAWKDLAQLKDLNKFQSWLNSIARNVIKNSFRRQKQDLISKATSIDQIKDAGSDDSGPVETVITKEQQDVVRQALQQIPEQYREPLVLFYRQEQSVKTVAEQLNLSEEAIKQRLSRGRKLLKERFAAMVETTISRTGPGKSFTAAVITSITGIAIKSSTTAGIASITSKTGTTTGITTLTSGITARIITAATVVTIGVGTVLTYKYLIKPEKKPDSFQILNTIEQQKEPSEEDSQRLQNDEANTSLAQALKEVQPDIAKDSKDTPQVKQPEKETVAAIEQMGTYYGIVTDAAAKPIEGVVVRRYWYSYNLPEGWMDDLEAITNVRGEFELGPLPVPDISQGKNIYSVLLFERADYGLGWSQAYGVGLSHTFQQHLSVTLLGSSVTTGRVVDEQGNGITGAIVIAKLPMSYDEYNRPKGEFEISVATADANGEFVCTDLPAGSRFHIAVLKKGYEIYDTSEIYERKKYPFRAGHKDLLMTLKPGGAIKGQLVLDGRPYQKAGIIVEARVTGSRVEGRGLTDENGQFEIIGLDKTHRFTLTIHNTFFTGTGLICKPAENINLRADSQPMVKVELQKGLPVTITVVDQATGQGITNLPVSIALYDPNYRQLVKPVNIRIASGSTNDVGQYELHLTPNYYRLRTKSWVTVREEDFEKHFRISDKQSSFNLTVAVISKPKVRGRLVNASGKPIRGYVWLGGRRTITDEHGRFEADEPKGNAAGICPFYAFDIEKQLGRTFFWQKSDDANDLKIILEPLAGVVGRLIDQNSVPITNIIPEISIVNPFGNTYRQSPGIWDIALEYDGGFSFEGIPVGVEMVIKTAICANLKLVDIGSLKEGRIRTLKIGHLQPSEVLNVGDVFVLRETIPGFEDDNIEWDRTLAGQVTNESGDVMVGFDLEISYENRRFSEVTDINGRYEIVGLPADKKVELRVSGTANMQSRAGRKRYRESFDVICDGNDFDIQLSEK